MIIGIIAAMRKELDLLMPLLENRSEAQIINGFTFYSGSIGRHGIVMMQCGIGKVNAAVGTLTLIDNFTPECVINTGVAGGADPSMHVLDLLVATGVAYHDVWCGPGTPYGAAAGFEVILKPWNKFIDAAKTLASSFSNVKYGLICSGDKFVSKEEEISDIKMHFPDCLAVDMESASISQVCKMKNVHFGILRAISDTPGQDDNISQYNNFWDDAPSETFKALVSVLNVL